MHRFIEILPLVGSVFTIVASGLVVYSLLANYHRFYHLWNRFAAILYACVCLGSLFRAGMEIHDIATDHERISEGLCTISFGVNQFLSCCVEALYVVFILVLCVPNFSEPTTKAAIEMAVVPGVVVAFGWATCATSIPLFMDTPLQHRHAWCWIDEKSTSMRYAFDYVPSVISVLVSTGFVLWVISVDTRVRKWRVLTFGIMDFTVVLLFMIFAFVGAGKSMSSDWVGFDLFAVYISLHDVVRAFAFIIAEKLDPRVYLPCCAESSPPPPSAGEHGQTNTVRQNQIALAHDQVHPHQQQQQEQQQHPATTPQQLSIDPTQQQQHHHHQHQTSYYGSSVDGGMSGVGAAPGDTTDFPPPGATAATATATTAATGTGPNENTELVSGGGDDIGSVMEIGDDTLTYFIRVLQRNGVDYYSQHTEEDEDSVYAGGRGASVRESGSVAPLSHSQVRDYGALHHTSTRQTNNN